MLILELVKFYFFFFKYQTVLFHKTSFAVCSRCGILMLNLKQEYFCQKVMLQYLIKVDVWDQAFSGCSSSLYKNRHLI